MNSTGFGSAVRTLRKLVRWVPMFGLIWLLCLGPWPLRKAHAQTGTAHSITLSWPADSSATGGFNVYRGTTTGGPYTKIGSAAAGATSYTDTTGVAATEYYYVITALDTASPPDESAYSNQASATALGNPNPPGGLQATAR